MAVRLFYSLQKAGFCAARSPGYETDERSSLGEAPEAPPAADEARALSEQIQSDAKHSKRAARQYLRGATDAVRRPARPGRAACFKSPSPATKQIPKEGYPPSNQGTVSVKTTQLVSLFQTTKTKAHKMSGNLSSQRTQHFK